MSEVKTKEPLIRIIKRDRSSFGYKVWVRAAAIILALVVDAVFIYSVTGLNPLSVYGVMLNGTFMTSIRFSWAMRDLVTLLCIGIALAPAFKMRFWNIGAEGQVLVGGLATAMIMVKFGGSLPTPMLFLVMFLTSVIAGGLWGFIPAVFKAYWNTNETLFTLMMNYVATSIVACMTNILRGKASSLGKLNMSTQAGWFPQFMGQRYNINILIVVILMFVMFFYLKYSKQGYEITVVGESENTARYAGINVKWVTIRTMIISGAICGLVGFLIVAGRDQTISTTSAGGNGFTAIIVAWLAKFNTFYMALISFLLMIFQSIAAPLPAFLITFANANLFGWWQGAILSWSSAMAGAAVCFFIARILGRDVAEKLTSKAGMQQIDTFFEKYGKNTVLICRLLPFISFDIVSYAAGLTSMSFISFFVATGVGQLPATIVYSYVGGMLTGGAKLLVTGLLILFALSALIFMGRKIYMDRQNKKAK